MESILVIGAGVFGLSTALAASKDHHVVLIDDGNPNAASRGLGRIYRSQYPREEYEGLARDARALWETEPFRGNFHKAIKRIVHPDGTQDEDQDAAWIDARLVMHNALREAEERGVSVVSDSVTQLIWDERRCIGVMTRTGVSFYANTILLALGAALPGFLEREKRPIGDVCEAIVVPWMCLRLSDDKYSELKEKDIMVHPGLAFRDDPYRWLSCPNVAQQLITLRSVDGAKDYTPKRCAEWILRLEP